MRHFIGVDLGGTNIAAGIVRADGTLIHKKSVPTRSARGHGPVVADIAALCRDMIPRAEICAIGIGSPGTVDDARGVITYANNLHFRDVPIRAMIREKIRLPLRLENDANCAAWGEHIAGAAKGSASSVTVTLGTGVGGGVIINGAVMGGAFGGGGELGHSVICVDGEPCTCGRRGCWEVYASAAALVREARAAAAKAPHSRLLTEADGDPGRIHGGSIFAAAEAGDRTAQAVVGRYLRRVAAGITNIVNTLQPEVIVIGGGISAQGDKIIAPITEMVTREVYGGVLKTRIAAASLGNDAGIIGAALLDYAYSG